MAKHGQDDVDRLIERLQTAMAEAEPAYRVYRKKLEHVQDSPDERRRIA
jgi:hypothetical protein